MMEEDFEEGGEEEEEVEEELDPDNPDHAFAILEKQFNKTITEMEQDPTASLYAEDFAKLFEHLFMSHTKENELKQQCEELETKLQETNNQLELATKLAETDASTIDDLKGQIQQSWKMADTAHYREQMAQEIIDNLRKQIQDLAAELELKNTTAQDENEEMGQLSKHKEGLQRERDKLANEVQQLNQKIDTMQAYQDDLEKKNTANDLKINETTQKLEEVTMDLEKQKMAKEKLDIEYLEIREQLENKDTLVSELNTLIVNYQKQIAKSEALLKEQKFATEKLQRDVNMTNNKMQKMTVEHEHLLENLENEKKETQKTVNELKVMKEEARHMKKEISKMVAVKENMEKKIKLTESEKDVAVMEREKLRQMVSSIEREISGIKKTADADKRQLENCTREKEILSKNILRHQALTQDHMKIIKIQEQSKRKLESEIDEFKLETGKQRKQISYLERERDRLAEEELDLTNKIETLMEDIRYKKNEIYELKKSLAELDNKMRMQQNLFEAVRADRNALQKSLQETTAEVGELKNKLKIGNYQGEQLKEDIAMKEQLLVKAENILRKVTKEKENLIVELNNGQEYIKSLKDEISELSAEEKRLHKVILDADRTIRQQAKDLEQLMNERDILGSQLVRRNDEIALLYEKIRILQSTLHRGEAQYGQRLGDIRLLKIEIRRLRQEKNLLTKSVNNMIDLRQEIFHLERDLTRERLKCRALEEELQHPLNIHRWRKLEGSDPQALELLQKIQLLQKRLLSQSSQAVERERVLKETERLYLNLRQVVSRQPGAEIQSELTKTQRALAIRNEKMKCLVSELNMTERQVIEYKASFEKVTEELNNFKKKYYEEQKARRSRMELLEADRRASQVSNRQRSQSQLSAQLRFAGGGFRMSVDRSSFVSK